MKHIVLALLVSGFSLTAGAADVPKEFGGTCTIYASGNHDLFYRVDVPFRFPDTETVFQGENTFTFGTGTALINQNIKMMDTNKNIVERPLFIKMSVAIAPDRKTKSLTVEFSMFNIFKNRQESLTISGGDHLNPEASGTFDYFQEGFSLPNSGSASRDDITTSTAFCNFGDHNPRH